MSPIVIGVALAVVVAIGLATWKAPRLTSVILWALVATIFLGAALLIAFPGPFAEKAIWLSLLVPVIWAGLQFWVYWERRSWVVASGLIGISLASAALVFTLEPSLG
ncbi:MAG: hypothetical protein AAGH41_08760 [Pseudomonadota bacterium]